MQLKRAARRNTPGNEAAAPLPQCVSTRSRVRSTVSKRAPKLLADRRPIRKSFIHTGISRFYRLAAGECHFSRSCWIFPRPPPSPFRLSTPAAPLRRSVNTTNPPAIKHRLARSSFLFFWHFSSSLCLCSSFLTSPPLPLWLSLLSPPPPPPTAHRPTSTADAVLLAFFLFFLFFPPSKRRGTALVLRLFRFSKRLLARAYPEATLYGSSLVVAQQRIINYRRR